jgi:hypothetical protein
MKDVVPDEGIPRKLNSYFLDLYFIFYKFSNFKNAQVQNKRQTVGSSCLKLHVDWRSRWIGRPRGSNGGERPRRHCMRERAGGPHWSASDGGARTARQRLSVEVFAGLGKMAALIGQLDGGDNAEAGTSGSEAWRAEAADMELGGNSMEVADPEWSVAELQFG